MSDDGYMYIHDDDGGIGVMDCTQYKMEICTLACFPPLAKRDLGEVLTKMNDRVTQLLATHVAHATRSVAHRAACIKVAKVLTLALEAVLEVRVAVEFGDVLGTDATASVKTIDVLAD